MLIMKAIISNFRSSKHSQYGNQMIVLVDGVSTKEKANRLIGKKAVWKSSAGKEISGEVKAAHGSKGAVRVLFEKGMPGQSVGQRLDIQ